jgi:hypothetical protein
MVDAERKVRTKARSLGVQIEVRPMRDRRFQWVELISPDGFMFDSGTSTMLCSDWDEAWARFEHEELVDEEE